MGTVAITPPIKACAGFARIFVARRGDEIRRVPNGTQGFYRRRIAAKRPQRYARFNWWSNIYDGKTFIAESRVLCHATKETRDILGTSVLHQFNKNLRTITSLTDLRECFSSGEERQFAACLKAHKN
jgi:hypothetical protein